MVRDLLLARPWRSAGVFSWLVIDLLTGDRVRQMSDLELAPSWSPKAILIPQHGGQCRRLVDGALLIPATVLWALLDPLQADDVVCRQTVDRDVAEAEMRAAVQRFRTRLYWWRNLDGDFRDDCRDLLRGYKPDLRDLWDVLDQAADQLPVATLEVPDESLQDSAPKAKQPSVDLPSTSDQLATWIQDPQGFGVLYGADFLPRYEQATMVREVSNALARNQSLLIEAGTGVGKTLAYLVPLISQIRRHGTRAVVSTHTRALQSQILDKDLPRLQPLLDEKKFSLLMGRRNYLCRRQRQSFLTKPPETLDDALQAVAFRLWLRCTDDGLREELTAHPLLANRVGELFDSADLCLPGLCYEGNECFVQRARRQARESDILVVNHSLLLHDLRAGHTLLGEMNHLVIDEAHRLPSVTLETHAVACGSWRLADVEELLGAVRAAGSVPERVSLTAHRLAEYGPEGQKASGAAEYYGQCVGRAFDAFRTWWKALAVRVDADVPPDARSGGKLRIRDKDEAFGAMRSESGHLLEALAEAAESFAALAGRTSMLDDLSTGLEDDLAQLAQGGALLRALHQDIHFLLSDPSEDWVTWLEPGSRRGVRVLGATRLEAGTVLREYWQGSDLAPIVTSATLAVGEDFTHMLSELGLTRRHLPTQTFASPSPFDHHRQSLILAPKQFPAPNAPDFGRAVGDLMSQLALKIPRKTMGLFTSYRLIREASEVMIEAGLSLDGPGSDDADLPGDRPRLLVQSPKTGTKTLLERFRQSPRAVLLGTSTFWEGVDFPGEDLEILVVTKLPFLVPNDPWVEARCDRISASGDNPFTSFMVRDAVLRLRQGIGRLIRRVSDRGVILILDNRLHTKNYGVTFLNALPVVPGVFAGNADLLDRIDDFFQQPGPDEAS